MPLITRDLNLANRVWKGFRAGSYGIHYVCISLSRQGKDPDEVVNLAERPEYAELAGESCAKIRQFQEDAQDPWIHKWVYE